LGIIIYILFISCTIFSCFPTRKKMGEKPFGNAAESAKNQAFRPLFPTSFFPMKNAFSKMKLCTEAICPHFFRKKARRAGAAGRGPPPSLLGRDHPADSTVSREVFSRILLTV